MAGMRTTTATTTTAITAGFALFNLEIKNRKYSEE